MDNSNPNFITKLRNFFSTSSYSRTISALALLIVAAAVPLTLMNLSQEQDIRQRASVGSGARFDACKFADGSVVPGTPGVDCNGVDSNMLVYVSWQGWNGCSDSGAYVHQPDCRFVGANLCYKDHADNKWRMRGSRGNSGAGNVFPDGSYAGTERSDGGMGLNIEAGHTYTVALYEDSYCTVGSLNCINGINASGPNLTISQGGGACGGTEKKTPRAEITIRGTSTAATSITARVTGPTTGTVNQPLTFTSTAQAPAGKTIARNDIYITKEINGTGTLPEGCATPSGNPMYCFLGRTASNTNTVSFTPTTPGIYKATVLVSPNEGAACSNNPYVTYPYQGITFCGENGVATVNVTGAATGPTDASLPTGTFTSASCTAFTGTASDADKAGAPVEVDFWLEKTKPGNSDLTENKYLGPAYTVNGAFSLNPADVQNKDFLFTGTARTVTAFVINIDSNGNPTTSNTSRNREFGAKSVTCGGVTPPITLAPGSSQLNLTLKLGAIGGTGENASPKRTERDITVCLYPPAVDSTGDKDCERTGVIKKTGKVNYASGKFTNATFDLGTIAQSTYQIFVKTSSHLRKRVSGIQTVGTGVTQVPETTLIVGDVNGDNKANIADYNVILSCFDDKANTAACGANKALADLDDDGDVDGVDYNVFIRSLAVRDGD